MLWLFRLPKPRHRVGSMSIRTSMSPTMASAALSAVEHRIPFAPSTISSAEVARGT
jgi:hypothetical protein